MCASEQCFGWGRKPCSVLYLKRLPKLAKANTVEDLLLLWRRQRQAQQLSLFLCSEARMGLFRIKGWLRLDRRGTAVKVNEL